MIYRDRWTASFNWHCWFAWHPVQIGAHNYWLTRIWRRRRAPDWKMRLNLGPLLYGITWWEYSPTAPEAANVIPLKRA